jgi:signal transduction histidine kinase
MTKIIELLRRGGNRVAWWALSVPIFLKILGIGMLVTVLFGSVAFYQIRTGMLRTHYQIHGETALSLAMSLAGRVETLMIPPDFSALNVEVNRTMGEFPDVRYIVLQDTEGNIVSHGFTFPKEAPPDLMKNHGDLCASCHSALSPTEIPVDLLETPPQAHLSTGYLRAYTRNEGLILEVNVPVGGGKTGRVRLGVGDKIIAREMGTITRSLAFSLTLCVVVGLSLAVVLAFVLVQPIRNLVLATQRLRVGDFTARAKVFSRDEIGHLAEVFNQMTEGLEMYRQAVAEKEAARQMLIGKIVQAQEEERKHVARELHDQLGQMLSKTLLTIDSSCGGCPERHPRCPEIREDIRAMIDEVRLLAWNVRPSILDDYGLDHALARYIAETAKRVDFTLDYQSVIPPDLVRFPGPEVEVSLYRIAQEAVTNILRHAKATEASVILMYHTQETVLLIEDNGVGFNAGAREQGPLQSLGLMGMRERAALVGGEVTIDSEPGKGTTIRVRIPLKEGPRVWADTGLKSNVNTNSNSG